MGSSVDFNTLRIANSFFLFFTILDSGIGSITDQLGSEQVLDGIIPNLFACTVADCIVKYGNIADFILLVKRSDDKDDRLKILVIDVLRNVVV